MTLDKLPVELVQQIALQLENDSDLANLAHVCAALHAAINAGRSGIWRGLFLRVFGCRGLDDVRHQYQTRREVLRNGAHFKQGNDNREYDCLKVLRELIIESCGVEKEDGTVEGLSHAQMLKFVRSTNLLSDFFVPTSKASTRPLLYAVQVVLSHLSLDIDLHLRMSNFPNSQKAVYATPLAAPIFKGRNKQTVNLEWLLHMTNFWKNHLTVREEHTLAPNFADLAPCDRPKGWKGSLSSELTMIGKHWKGSYAYLSDEEVCQLRTSFPGEEIFSDIFDYEDGFQTLTTTPTPQSQKEIFSAEFDTLGTQPTPAPSPTKKRPSSLCANCSRTAAPPYLRFQGHGVDRVQFLTEGRIYPLPPQQGIPGWRRVLMIKYFYDAEIESAIDPTSLWAYEGCILPGGEIMLGRWWYPESETDDGQLYCGPFIFWNVPKGDPEEEWYEWMDGTDGEVPNEHVEADTGDGGKMGH
ncbi:MAG: hypothetical protein M1833_007115 [Piccolia ochrophora]|nr:MAG: hypothetical protein M1833_007115 [Piccolia ochrophora]